MKIVINADYGGFGLSDEAMRMYLDAKYGAENWFEDKDKIENVIFFVNGENLFDFDIPRDDEVLVEVVEALTSEKASGRYACLKVVEVPNDVEWHIAETDGLEHVAEDHRTWW